MKDDIKAHLTEHGVAFEENENLLQVVGQVDVVYQTRIQKERFGDRIEDYEKARGKYIINREVMAALSRDAIVMHPLPRVDEIDSEVDSDPRAAYFRQAHNGLHIRMALLRMVLDA
jgi:aspartate carbamoyltransferase catalytic subunit